MSNNNFDANHDHLIKFLIAIFAALIGAGATVWVAMNQFYPKISIQNELSQPIVIYVDGVQDKRIEAGNKGRITLGDVPGNIRYVVVKVKTSTGKEFGDEISYTYKRAFGGDKFIVTNKIGETFYFSPILNNETNMNCQIIVNDGLSIEQEAGHLLAYKQNIRTGYFRWTKNSNVTLYCGDRIFWWGIRNGNSAAELESLISPKSGDVILTFDK